MNIDGNRVLIRFDPPAGREQVDAIGGRKGEWLHNGTWRVRVREVTPVPNPFGADREILSSWSSEISPILLLPFRHRLGQGPVGGW